MVGGPASYRLSTLATCWRPDGAKHTATAPINAMTLPSLRPKVQRRPVHRRLCKIRNVIAEALNSA